MQANPWWSVDLEAIIPMAVARPSKDSGGCENYGPFLGTLNNGCRIILRTPKGTIILTTTHSKIGSMKAF